MKYADGEIINVDDRVIIDGGDEGYVVVCIENGIASQGYNADYWGYLDTGVLILTNSGALVRIERAVNSRGSIMIAKN